MLFHEVRLSHDEILQRVADALRSQKAAIFLDASLLLHAYEIGASARDELLGALEGIGQTVKVPLWAARETWRRSYDPDLGKTPLKQLSAQLESQLKRFVAVTRGFVDEDLFGQAGTMTRAEFQEKLDTAQADLLALTQMAGKHERRPEDTSAKLIPFINDHVLRSDITALLARVAREGDTRYAQQVPPGWVDGGAPLDAEAKKEGAEPKGKKANRFGDLIIWFEILAEIHSTTPEQLVLITRDVKKDWVYKPQRLLDGQGRLVGNATITLPDPLLVHEAMSVCPSLAGVHILSLDAFAQVLNNKLGKPVPRLLAALQADQDVQGRRPPRPQPGQAAPGEHVSFTPEDLNYEPTRGDLLDEALLALNVPDFRVQNRAVESLPEALGEASRAQQITLGRLLAQAAAAGAREPADYLVEVLQDTAAPGDLRRHLLLGALAGVYLTDQAELRKPASDDAVIEALFALGTDAVLAPAFEAVLTRMTAQRKQYMALPTDAALSIPLDLLMEREEGAATLRGIVLANGQSLIEESAPAARRISGLGEDTPADQLLVRVAHEFCVPRRLLQADEATNRFLLPPTLGFVRWGPGTGVDLR